MNLKIKKKNGLGKKKKKEERKKGVHCEHAAELGMIQCCSSCVTERSQFLSFGFDYYLFCCDTCGERVNTCDCICLYVLM